jgi:thiol:disulfide interchange protein DsbD
MPCVLPVIALKIFGFVQQAGEHPRRVFHLGLAFVAGVFAFFLGLATLIAVLHSNGIRLNWGFQFQHPRIFVGLIALVFMFGLNLLGVFEITLSGGTASKLSELSSREGYGGAFFHGLFTTLLGTSCTAPFLGAALGAAFAAPTYVVYLIFTAIAAGMSLPYFLLTAKPAWMRFLPKPGTWMERLKQLVGFVMLAVVVWLLSVLGQSRGLDPLIAVSSFLLVLALACWIYGAFGSRFTSWLAILVVLAGGYFVFLRGKLDAARPQMEASATNDPKGISWQPWTAQRVADAVKNGQPVFIDFTAEWCLNCKANEKFVLNTQSVKAALKEKNVLTLKADWTNEDPAITAVLAKYGRAGVPAYLLYPGNGAEPTLFPEILTQSVMLDELGKLKNQGSAALVPNPEHPGS